MNKRTLIEALLKQLEEELLVAINAAKTAREDATNEESKPENEYDTRALEASYVAQGQAKRVIELEEMVYIFKHVPLKDFKPNDEIAETALVKVESNSKQSFLFVMSKGGGHLTKVNGLTVQVVTPNSPLGEALIGLKAGQSASIEIGDKEKEYKIISVE